MIAETNFVVPDLAIKYILLQRTSLQHYYRIIKRLKVPFKSFVFNLEADMRRTTIKSEFVKEMSREYRSIKPYLPESASKVLDIGCGVAGIDVLLSKHYCSKDKLDFFLLDRTEVNQNVYYGFKKEGAYYNSLEIAKSMLAVNQVGENNIHLLDVQPDYSIMLSDVDLVISLISWGFHYPVSTYLEAVYKLLKPNGRLILDVRKGTNGEEELKSKFQVSELIKEDEKSFRLLLIK